MARSPQGESGLRAWARVGVQLTLTLVVTWFIVDRVGLGLSEVRELDPAAWRPGLVLLAGSAVTFICGAVFSGYLWGETVRDLGGTSLSVSSGVRVFLIANLGRYVPGKVWQIAGLAVLARRQGVPATLSGVSAVIAHGVSLVAAALIGTLAVPLTVLPGSASGWWLPALALLVTGLALAPPVFTLVLDLLSRTKLSLDWSALSPRLALKWLALFLVHWVIYGLSFVLLAKSFGLSGEPVQLLVAYVAAYVIGYVAIFAPAGIGVREASLVGLLAPLMGQVPAAGIAVIARLWTTVVEVIPAAIMAFIEFRAGGDLSDEGLAPESAGQNR